jgi:hypothetical protein
MGAWAWEPVTRGCGQPIGSFPFFRYLRYWPAESYRRQDVTGSTIMLSCAHTVFREAKSRQLIADGQRMDGGVQALPHPSRGAGLQPVPR